MKGYNLNQSYAHNHIMQSFFKDRYEINHYGERFEVGEQAIMIKDSKKNLCHWFIFDSYNLTTGSLYKYVHIA